ncbi:MAG: molybdenum cofactor biosynthesis protein MoaE [Pseudomonadota bacterium]
MAVDILNASFDPGEALSAFDRQCTGAGAVVSFLGKVRGDDGAVTGLYLEHYPGVTERTISGFVDEARARWAIENCRILHRVGTLAPDEPIVFVAVAARHRRSAFDAGAFLMDYLKTRALFWKKELCVDGDRWIDPRREDYEDADRWRETGAPSEWPLASMKA